MKPVALASFAVIVAVVSTSISIAQPPHPANPLKFEVATIRPGKLPSDPGKGESFTSGGMPGGQFQMVNTPLKQWVKMGLSVRDYALRAPSWLDTSRFDLLAKVPADTPIDQKDQAEMRAEMMKALLVERFGLTWHEELQTVSGYELVPDKKVLAQPSTLLERLRGHGSSSGGSVIQATNMSMSDFAGALGDILGRPVVDATHLSGGFDIKVRWRPSDDAELARERQYGKQYGIDVDNLPDSVFTAVREQLGLRLQSAQVPSKVTVVDNINRQPTEN